MLEQSMQLYYEMWTPVKVSYFPSVTTTWRKNSHSAFFFVFLNRQLTALLSITSFHWKRTYIKHIHIREIKKGKGAMGVLFSFSSPSLNFAINNLRREFKGVDLGAVFIYLFLLYKLFFFWMLAVRKLKNGKSGEK